MQTHFWYVPQNEYLNVNWHNIARRFRFQFVYTMCGFITFCFPLSSSLYLYLSLIPSLEMWKYNTNLCVYYNFCGKKNKSKKTEFAPYKMIYSECVFGFGFVHGEWVFVGLILWMSHRIQLCVRKICARNKISRIPSKPFSGQLISK